MLLERLIKGRPISKLIDLLVKKTFHDYFSVTTNEEWYSVLKNEINAPENLLIELSSKFQKTYFDKLISYFFKISIPFLYELKSIISSVSKLILNSSSNAEIKVI